MSKNIFLCGFMGCGKSTVGKSLAALLRCPFVDMDSYIEKAEGRKVSEIFAVCGERYFRQREAEAIQALGELDGAVIATGGGALLRPENAEAARRAGVVVLLDVPLTVIAERLRGDTTRPLLQKSNPAAEMERLYRERLPLYRAAADFVVAADRAPKAVAAEILNHLRAD